MGKKIRMNRTIKMSNGNTNKLRWNGFKDLKFNKLIESARVKTMKLAKLLIKAFLSPLFFARKAI